MLETATKNYSFKDYLDLKYPSDLKYELFNGELIPMPPASGLHAEILCLIYDILKAEIQRLQLDWVVRPGNVGVRTGVTKSRIPDLIVITETQRQFLKTLSSAILEEPPVLAVEIVSPNNPDDDYRYKRSEYAALEIPEYWIIDPQEQKVSVLTLVYGFYDMIELKGENRINSPSFPELTLTVEQVLNP
ncbi:Uma2 family endonuclease [Limnoraphis robusta Tam1]|uniref:Uma2 family endonuclease n=1 Tax=Limnoraphis robusta TaxID=1118279 RepID=UPI002B1FF726|nr:Uma2 family endonuclease [Limnoraphis robusta]MEA5538928.1 Uma2 family endonuclease [Limnoraphis robusta Tam1]